jgi:DNA-binding FrmR family transcriptional regulator
MKQNPDHHTQVVALKRIEGQVRGIQKMIEERRYCIDILFQLRSVMRALGAVQKKVYRRHLEGCVTEAMQGISKKEKQKKIDEVISLLNIDIGG